MAEVLRTVLVVEDEPDIREVARLALAVVGGLDVRTCGSGTEALRAARSERPDLVLLDVMMPEMDGPSTLRAMHADRATHGIPVVFISARVQSAEIDRYLGLGVIGVIPKPFDPMTLTDQVRDLWRRHKDATDERPPPTG